MNIRVTQNDAISDEVDDANSKEGENKASLTGIQFPPP